MSPFSEYRGLRVLVTGHTGFKGAWLCEWLNAVGARVCGFALPPEADRHNLFAASGLGSRISSTFGDIKDFEAVRRCVKQFQPDLIFHLAAQPLVRRSYREPIETFGSNVMGTVHLLEAARQTRCVRAIVCVTTDKVYENREWIWGYREADRLGGRDPYSGSKACAELVAAVYQETMMPMSGSAVIATARGGNVVGGGDWSEDRIVPDTVRALLDGKPTVLRNPSAIRPWQYVLELCRGYLQLGTLAIESPQRAAGAWNFGPESDRDVTVAELVADIHRAWGRENPDVQVERSALGESLALRLDSSKARHFLGWKPVLAYPVAIARTVQWYRRFHVGREPAHDLVTEELLAYVDEWTRCR